VTDLVNALLWRIVQADFDADARVLRRLAHQHGASAQDIATAWAERDERLRPTYIVRGNWAVEA
jgi:hypothetical protein